MGVLKMLRLCLLVLGFLLVEGVDIQDATNTNTKLFTGNQALDSGTLGFGLGVGASVLGSALLGGGCGRRKEMPKEILDSFLVVTIVETTTIATPPRTIIITPLTIMEVTTTQIDAAVLLFLSPTIMVTSTET